MEKELEIIEIDNNEYYIIKEIKHGNYIYLYLSNTKDDDDMIIRKTTLDNKDLILPLQNQEEFNIACTLIFKNN